MDFGKNRGGEQREERSRAVASVTGTKPLDNCGQHSGARPECRGPAPHPGGRAAAGSGQDASRCRGTGPRAGGPKASGRILPLQPAALGRMVLPVPRGAEPRLAVMPGELPVPSSPSPCRWQAAAASSRRQLPRRWQARGRPPSRDGNLAAAAEPVWERGVFLTRVPTKIEAVGNRETDGSGEAGGGRALPNRAGSC